MLYEIGYDKAKRKDKTIDSSISPFGSPNRGISRSMIFGKSFATWWTILMLSYFQIYKARNLLPALAIFSRSSMVLGPSEIWPMLSIPLRLTVVSRKILIVN